MSTEAATKAQKADKPRMCDDRISWLWRVWINMDQHWRPWEPESMFLRMNFWGHIDIIFTRPQTQHMAGVALHCWCYPRSMPSLQTGQRALDSIQIGLRNWRRLNFQLQVWFITQPPILTQSSSISVLKSLWASAGLEPWRHLNDLIFSISALKLDWKQHSGEMIPNEWHLHCQLLIID